MSFKYTELLQKKFYIFLAIQGSLISSIFINPAWISSRLTSIHQILLPNEKKNFCNADSL